RVVVCCTVYDRIPGLEYEALTALSLFNEVILREALRLKIPIIDLRLICTERGDFSELSPIEPSKQGGDKIAAVIAGYLLDTTIPERVVRVFT
ncbi:MAG: SGNH/GDSL hydrolase family protein, partial [Gammaproteobacteria bacterium]|nr:SGNH/GDSL hydrolase family protein [Gammaproteobacteria bacterium]